MNLSQSNNPIGKLTLGIETATSLCSVALLSEDGTFVERSTQTDRRHAEVLPGLIDALFKETNSSWKQVDLIAVSIGPGSFTGLRVGLSFAKGIAVGIGCPVVPIGTLNASAVHFLRIRELASSTQFSPFRLCPLVPARKAEAFGQVFEVMENGIINGGDPMLVDRMKADELSAEGVILFGEGGRLLGLSPNETQGFVADVGASAGVIALLGRNRWMADPASLRPASTLEPKYLKEFTVTVKKVSQV